MDVSKSKVMKGTSGVGGTRMNVALNGELFKEVELKKIY